MKWNSLRVFRYGSDPGEIEGVRPFRIDFKSVALSLFLLAGFVKADPRLQWLPVDLTVLMAGIVIVLCIWAVLASRLKVPRNILWLILLFGLFIPGAFLLPGGAYSVSKTVRLFTITLLSAVGPAILVRTREDLMRFLSALALIGLVMSVDAVVGLILLGDGTQRLAAFSSDTIALGQAAGITGLWAAVLSLYAKKLSLVQLVAMLVAGFSMVGSGSRGPILACLAGLLVFGWNQRAWRVSGVWRTLMLGLLVSLVIWGAERFGPTASIARIVSFFEGNVGNSGAVRLEYWELAIGAAGIAPFGLGWGGFAEQFGSFGSAARTYPHNILFEVFLEGGWLAGVGLAGLVLKGWQTSWRQARANANPGAGILLAGLVFCSVNALISGDINDNRLFFAFLSMALCWPTRSDNGLITASFQQVPVGREV